MIVMDTEIVRLHKADISMPQLIIILALLKNDLGMAGSISGVAPQRYTLATLCKATGMPTSTVSRILWEIIDTHKLASYGTDKDRRKKPVLFNRVAYEKLVGLKGGIAR